MAILENEGASMSDDKTQSLSVQILQRLDAIDGRLAALEAKTYDTRPIWEKALGEILEVKMDIRKLSKKFDELAQDIYNVRSRVGILEDHN